MISARHKLFVRAALALQSRRLATPSAVDLPIAAWQTSLRHAELLAETEQRGWPGARAECRRRLYGRLCELRFQLDVATSELADRPDVQQATAREIYDDLVALESEYPALRLDMKQRELAVTTEPITLEQVPLGRFEIVVAWSPTDGALSYRVVSLDPNPSSVNEDVTHPHVSDEDLCEGEGGPAIRRCMASVRLWDFFAVVSCTLATYNASSAFVTLDRWEGVSCSCCGYYPERDYMSSCDRCDCDLCDECSAGCGACGNCCCNDCSAPCRGCCDNHCGACLRNCQTCHEDFCQECLLLMENAIAAVKQPKTKRTKKPAIRSSSPPRAVLRLSPVAWAKLVFLRDAGPTEIGGFGISAADDLLLVNDVRLIRQNCDWASVAFDDAAVADFFDGQVDAGRRPAEFGRIWVHTHPGDSARPSLTDEVTFARVFGACDWAVMLIVARGGATYARLQFGVGPGGAFEIPVEVDYGVEFSASDWPAWQAEYAACVIERSELDLRTAGLPPNLSEAWEEFDEWLGESRPRRFPSMWDEEALHDHH